MTCIVGIVHRGRVVLGGDSALSDEGDYVYRVDSPKVWRAGGFIVGDAGDYQFGVWLRHKIRWPDAPAADSDLLHEYMLVALPSELRALAKREGCEVPEGEALIGARGILWHLGPGRAERIAEPYASIGAGAPLALGALYATTRRTARARLLVALEAAAAHRGDVRAPFHFVEA